MRAPLNNDECNQLCKGVLHFLTDSWTRMLQMSFLFSDLIFRQIKLVLLQSHTGKITQEIPEIISKLTVGGVNIEPL